MTFLNPLLLWGLAAISIPILIHIFNLKRTKKIEFSTLMFLKEIQQSKYKKIKLKQLLILLCRIAFIIFLVTMFAKPFDKGFLGTPGEKAKSSVLIILDDSFSMQSKDKNGNDFENAKRKINETIDALGSHDEIFFSTISAIDRSSASVPLKNVSKLKDTLALIKTSEISRDLNEVMYYAEDILNSASNSHKEIYLFTDGQSTFINNEIIAAGSFKDNENVHLNIILTGTRKANNLSIDTINTVSKIFEKNRPVKLKTVINNHNNFNSSNKSVIITMGSYKEEKVIDIPANSTAEAEFILRPDATGFASGNIELVQSDISDDEISGDNKQYFSFYVPDKVNVLIASGSPLDAEYIKLVLSSTKEISANTETSTYFNIKEINASDISNENLSDYNSVVIINKNRFSSTESAKIREYIELGGGAVIYPGSLSDIENYNNELMKPMDLPYIGAHYDLATPVKFDKIDFDHPVFEGIFKKDSDKNNLNIESPEIKSGVSLTGGQNSVSIVTLLNGTNFMEEYSKGKGKLIMFASAPDMRASDFPAKNLFSPITIRSILYCSNINGIKPAIAGRDYFLELNKLSLKADSIKIISGLKDDVPLTLFIDSNAQLLNIRKLLSNTSNYRVENSGSELLSIPVNFNKEESITTRLKPEDIKAGLLKNYKMEANIILPDEQLTASLIDLRTGRDLWKYCLIFAVIFLLIEYLLARSILKSK